MNPVARASMLLLCTLFAVACSSPLDLDTPRERIIEQEAVKSRVPLTAVRNIYNDLSSGSILFDTESWSGEVDTVTGRLWLKGAWTQPSGFRGSIPLTRIALTLDSTACDGSDLSVLNGAGADSAVLTIYLPPMVFADQEFYPDGSTTLTIRLTRDSVNRRITGDVEAYINLIRPIVINESLEMEY